MVKKVVPIPKPRKARHYLREWRTYRGLTQERLAERVSLTAGLISQLENGQINYTQPTLEALAHALQCDPGDILSRDPRIDDALAELRKMLQAVSGPDQKKAITVVRTMLATGTDDK